jgi:hypothetical protein
VLVDGVAQVTAEDAADWVKLSAALRKRLILIARVLTTSGRLAKEPILARWAVLGRCGRRLILFLDEKFELVCSFRRLIFHGVVINIELGRFSLVFTAQLELKFLPGVILRNLVLLRIKKVKMR